MNYRCVIFFMSLMVQQAECHHFKGLWESNCIDLFEHGLHKIFNQFQVQSFLNYHLKMYKILAMINSMHTKFVKLLYQVLLTKTDSDCRWEVSAIHVVNLKLAHI